MSETIFSDTRQLRLETLIKLRWLAVLGQSIAVLVVAFGLKFDFALTLCFVLIACSAWLNVFLRFRYPASYRLNNNAAFAMLAYDVLQLAGLLYLTGGLENPFAFLLIVPGVVSATTLSTRLTLYLGALIILVATLLIYFHEPLPWQAGEKPSITLLYLSGVWVAIASSLAFTAVYTFRVANEARSLADALTATELVLQREQHLSALDGMAAAAAHELGTPLATIALVSKEMQRELTDENPLKEDAKLLRSQAERCREILNKLTSLSTTSEEHMARLPLSSLLEEVVSPHRDFGIEITISNDFGDGQEPVGRRDPGIHYGLGNIVENAVDHARNKVEVSSHCDENLIMVRIEDDGDGFAPETMERIGLPYISNRSGSSHPESDGLGLGLFIAKTLLERNGATIRFNNRGKGKGAQVEIEWPRSAFDVESGASPDLAI